MENFQDNLIQGAPENKTAIVKCDEGFIINNPDKNKFFCNQGTWNPFLTNSVNVDSFVGDERNHNLPKCRKIVCKRHPIIVNGRLLKSVRNRKNCDTYNNHRL